MVHDINRETVDEYLGRAYPWFQLVSHRSGPKRFAVCPYCENPVQLIALDRGSAASPRPYGSHTGQHVPGFAFDAEMMERCPYRLAGKSLSRDTRRPDSPLARRLIDLAIQEFDRAVLILRDDYGFRISNTLAGRMLRQWCVDRWYLYDGAHPRNLPWMIAYAAMSESIFGQPVSALDALAGAICAKVPAARFDASGRLTKGPGYYDIRMQTLRHRIQKAGDDTLIETIDVRFLDYTGGKDPDMAPVLYRRTITLEPGRFEALINTPPERARRDQRLLDLARSIAKECFE